MQKYAIDTRQQPSMRGGLAFLESGRDDLDNLVEIIMISRLEIEKARNPYILEFEEKNQKGLEQTIPTDLCAQSFLLNFWRPSI